VRGPRQSITVRRKERFAGIWVNRGAQEFIDAPGYLAVLSNREPEAIAPPTALERFQLGLDRTALLTPGKQVPALTAEERTYQQAVIRLLNRQNLFVQNPSGVEFLSEMLFRARIVMPAGVPIGRYEVEVFLFRDGALLQRQLLPIDIHKSGFEQLVFNTATEQPLIYGLLSVAMAIFAGWFAGVIFRRD
jgi:uncharacterized protein (TIGR02186 family)